MPNGGELRLHGVYPVTTVLEVVSGIKVLESWNNQRTLPGGGDFFSFFKTYKKEPQSLKIWRKQRIKIV